MTVRAYANQLAPSGFDELVRPVGSEQDFVSRAVDSMGLAGLMAARAEARRLVEDDGVVYGAPLDGLPSLDQASWRIDPLPVVISAGEWRGLETGLRQRAALLDAVLADLYGERRLISSGLLPAEVVLGHAGFLRAADGLAAPGLVLNATDLGRDADGRWHVVADRAGAPSGAGYAMANRRITSRVMAGLHRQTDLARLRGFFHTLTVALTEVGEALPRTSDDPPRVVLLSPGPASETAYDQSFLASLLGFPLVEADDLTARGGRVWIRATGRIEPVDVVLRRVDADYCDPLEFRGDSQIGLPGLVEATRRRAVSVVNPLGAGVLENPGLVPFLPAIARELLGEELVLRNAETWWCGDATDRAHALSRMDELVFKPLHRGRLTAARFGWQLSAADKDDLRREIEARPWRWVGQDPVPMSTAPIVTRGGLVPGRLVLRTFGVTQDGEHRLMQGGLARVNSDLSSTLVSSSAGAVAKDVWVLNDQEDTRPTWAVGPASIAGSLIPIPRPSVVAPRVADNLYWVGRYAERAESTARLLRVADDLVEDHSSRPETPGNAAMHAILLAAATLTGVRPTEEQSPLDQVRQLVADPTLRGTVAHAVGQLVRAAQSVRDQLSSDIWNVLGRLERTVTAIPPNEVQLQPQLSDILESLLAVSGVVAESMVRDQTWGFLDGGVRIERAQHTASLLGATLGRERPPITDGQVTEAVLEAGESVITHRRRSAAGEGPAWPVHSAVALMLLDPGNPRSVAFQARRLVDDFRLVEDDRLVSDAQALVDLLAGLDLVSLCAGDRSGLVAAVAGVSHRLRGLSDALHQRHFGRKRPQRVVLSGWNLR